MGFKCQVDFSLGIIKQINSCNENEVFSCGNTSPRAPFDQLLPLFLFFEIGPHVTRAGLGISCFHLPVGEIMSVRSLCLKLERLFPEGL